MQSHTHTPQLPTHTQMLTPMSEGCMFFFFFLLLAGTIAGTAQPSGQEEREGPEEERPDRLSTALAGSMVSQSHRRGGEGRTLFI